MKQFLIFLLYNFFNNFCSGINNYDFISFNIKVFILIYLFGIIFFVFNV